MAIASTILNCLTGYVGITTCTDEEPGSGLFIDSLPGVSPEMLQAIAEPNTPDYISEWSKIEHRAILAFRSLLLAKLNECYEIHNFSTAECIACENQDVLAVALWYLFGHYVMGAALASWTNSRFSTVDRQQVEELQADYYVQFERELTNAMRGIDLCQDKCIQQNEPGCVVPNGRISFRESLP